MKHYISLGAGVQSSTMALMFACGELEPMPDAAIFADTQAEPASVYRWLDWLEGQLPFPVHRVTHGSLRHENLRRRVSKKNGHAYYERFVPTFGREGFVPRKCTREFKILPIVRALRHLAGVPRGCKEPRVVQFIGISLDEVRRMKPARDPWIENRWPLVDARVDRAGCLRWMAERGYPTPPRSACVFCPYHSNAEWRAMQKEAPEEFASAVEFERAMPGEFLHSSLKPLDTIDFRSDVERGQGLLFDSECEGMCGV